jgi:hypothetical protein
VAGDRRYLVVREDGSRLSGTAKAPLLGVVASATIEIDGCRPR